MDSFVQIKVDDAIYGIDSELIYKIINPIEITYVPLVNRAIEGVCSLDGKIVIAISLAKLLNKKSEKFSKIVVIEFADAYYALLVEEVLDIEFIDEKNFEKSEGELEGFYKKDEEVYQVLNIGNVLNKIDSVSFSPIECAEVEQNIEEKDSERENNVLPYIFFKQGDEYFAINSEIAKELMFANKKITELPNSDEIVRGVVTVRNKAINVIDVNKLFFGKYLQIKPTSRFLIVTNEGKDLALLIDEIIDIKDMYLDNVEHIDGEDKKIRELYKDGEQIVSIIDESFLKSLIYKYAIEEEESLEEIERNEDMIEIAAFKIENEEYAIDIDKIQEIIKYSDITPLPETSEYIKGVINLRGEVVPVISLPIRLGYEEKITKDTKIIVCNFDGYRAGLLVDDVSEILFVDEKNVSKNEKNDSVVSSIVNLDNGKRVILILNLDILLNDEDVEKIKATMENA